MSDPTSSATPSQDKTPTKSNNPAAVQLPKTPLAGNNSAGGLSGSPRTPLQSRGGAPMLSPGMASPSAFKAPKTPLVTPKSPPQQQDVQREAARALANMTTGDQSERVVNEGGIEILVQLANDTKTTIAVEGLRGIANLSQVEDNQARLVSQQVLPPLITSCAFSFEPNDKKLAAEIVKHCTRGLAALTAAKSVQVRVANLGGVEPLVVILKDLPVSDASEGEAEITAFACQALSNLAQISDLQDSMVSFGVLPALVEHLAHTSPSVRQWSAQTLANLGKNWTYLAEMLQRAGVSTLVETQHIPLLVALSKSAEERVQYESAVGLGTAASTPLGKKDMIKLHGLEALLDLTTSEHASVRRAAAAGVAVVSEWQANLEGTANLGLAAVTQLLQAQDNETRVSAVRVLGNLAQDEGLQTVLVKARAHEAVLTVLAPLYRAQSDLQREAARCIAGLASNANLRAALHTASATAALCALLVDCVPAMMAESSDAFAPPPSRPLPTASPLLNPQCPMDMLSLTRPAALLHYEVSRALCLCCNFGPAFVAAAATLTLESLTDLFYLMMPLSDLFHLAQNADTPEVEECLLSAFALLARNSDLHPVLVENGLLPILVKALGNSSSPEGLILAAVEALNLITGNPAFTEVAADAECLPPLIVIACSRVGTVQVASVEALSHLALLEKTHAEFVSQGAIPLLVALTAFDVTAMAAAACECLAHLAPDEKLAARLVQAGAVASLLELLPSNEVTIRLPASSALASICAADGGRAAVEKEQGLTRVLMLLSDDNDEVCTEGVRCTANLSLRPYFQAEIVQVGGLDRLLELSRSSSSAQVQLEATRAVACVAETGSNQSSIVEQAGLSVIMQLALKKQDATIKADELEGAESELSFRSEELA
jgi:hypothetical protein